MPDMDLLELQRDAFGYFLAESSPSTGLVADSSRAGSPASIAATGLGLASYAAAVERGLVPRRDAAARVLATLRFLSDARHTAGHRGFYFHFLDLETGHRAWRSELSTIDTALLLAGALVAGLYFDAETSVEREIRDLADALYRRTEWNWARDGRLSVTHGWRPERGFLRYRWTGYNEALLLYLLALGSPTHPLPVESYEEWLSTYRWTSVYGYEYLYAGPLFIHQLPHVFVDFRGIRDRFMREHGIDYFENSRRATYVQRAYAARNPRGFRGYGENAWGITASDGPGRATRDVDGRTVRFFGYAARGVPYGPDDGTLSPWAVAASLPFAPEVVLPALDSLSIDHPEMMSEHGIRCSFNATLDGGWVSSGYLGLDQGPVVLMVENYLSDLVWRLTRRSPYVVEGLRRAGFAGGWLEEMVD